MKLRAIIYRVHLWAGLLLGAQLLLWMASGVVMSWFHIDIVHGDTRAAFIALPELEARSYVSPSDILVQISGVTEIRLTTLLGRPVYETRTPDGIVLFDAGSGEKLPPATEENVRAIAKSDYVGAASIRDVELMENPPHEYRGAKPVWRVTIGDDLATRLYISPSTGRIVSRRNWVWRLYDFFFMLHIMEYEDREDFNNPLLRAASATGLIFAISGIILVIWRLKQGQYRFGLQRSHKK